MDLPLPPFVSLPIPPFGLPVTAADRLLAATLTGAKTDKEITRSAQYIRQYVNAELAKFIPWPCWVCKKPQTGVPYHRTESMAGPFLYCEKCSPVRHAEDPTPPLSPEELSVEEWRRQIGDPRQ